MTSINLLVGKYYGKYLGQLKKIMVIGKLKQNVG
jgi:hypothetical protein